VKNQYFGDINDYRKYGVLRRFADAGSHLGICWMLTPDDGRTDGRKTTYLSDPKRWRSYDPDLFDVLADALNSFGGRNIARAQDANVLPRACFYGELTPDSAPARSRWLTEGLRALAAADLLFFDPDNGLEIPSIPFGRRNAGKFLYWREVEGAWSQARSLLIFQHFIREDRASYTRRLLERLQGCAPGGSVQGISTANVLFLVAAQPPDRDRVEHAVDLVQMRWKDQVAVARGST
jgi:hypothetical protein